MIIIAIDGPAAAGKGTLAKRLAETLKLPYLDTGLLYRATAKRVLEAGANPSDELAALAAALELRDSDTARSDLRDAATSKAASQVSAIPAVRETLLAYQRSYGNTKGAVLDGRDIGTVIFPQADIKLFVTASAKARAKRRHAEAVARGETLTLEDVLSDVVARDEADSTRATSPLTPAADATLIDTTSLSADEVYEHALNIIRAKTSKRTF